MAKKLSVALLGCGTVGTQVARLLIEQQSEWQARTGAILELSAIVVRDIEAPRDPVIDRSLLTTDMDGAIAGADIVIELMGGFEPARTAMLTALRAGATVVTGNKALLAKHGPELYEAAAANDTDLYYEAAVAGAVPVVYAVRESLAGDQVNKILGIVNGTTNYILDEMTTKGLGYDEVLKTAQELGFAEADPTADVDGFDAASKCAILASLAFHTRVSIDDVAIEGIRGITADDIAEAGFANYTIKLLAIAERLTAEDGTESISARVHPALVPNSHPLASVAGAYNAVVFECESAGRLMFYGQGAGGTPTASAVLSDIVAGAAHRVRGGHAPRESNYADLPQADRGSIVTRYQIRSLVDDQTGVLAEIGALFARNNVSIQAVHQAEAPQGGYPMLTIASHSAPEAALAQVVADLRTTSGIREVVSVLRMEGN